MGNGSNLQAGVVELEWVFTSGIHKIGQIFELGHGYKQRKEYTTMI